MDQLSDEILLLIGLELSLKDLSSLRRTSRYYNDVFKDSCYWKRRAHKYLEMHSAPNVAWHANPIETYQDLMEANENIRRSYAVLRKELKLLETRENLINTRLDNLRARNNQLNYQLLSLEI